MTAIVGLVAEDGSVYMGADGIAVRDDGSERLVESMSKLFSLSGKDGSDTPVMMLVGVAGSVRTARLVQYTLDLPVLVGSTVVEYMVVHFVEALRTCLRAGGNLLKDREVEMMDSLLLVAIKSKLFRIETDFQVGTSNKSYAAIGSGRLPALGAMYANANSTPIDRIHEALDAATDHTPYVGEPFTIMRLNPTADVTWLM